MSKITAVVNGESWLNARAKINTALKSVAVTNKLSWDWNDGTELDVNETNLDSSSIPNTPAWDIVATDVQWAINELDAKKSSKADQLLAIWNINNPLLDLPLNNNLTLKQWVWTVDFSRTTQATYVDRYGVLQTAAIDEPRFETDWLLMEGESTNDLLQSQTFDTTWAAVRASITADSVNAPDGTLTADSLVDTIDNNTHYINQSTTVTSGLSYTYSVFVKEGSRSQVYLDFGNTYFTGSSNARFDLTTLAITEGGDVTDSKITVLSDWWFKVQFSAVAIGTGSNPCYIYASENGSWTYIGNADTALYIWGAQLEALPFATSYIATTTAPVTKTADVCFIDNIDNVPNTNLEAVKMSCLVDFTSLGVWLAQMLLSQTGSTANYWYIREYSTDTRLSSISEAGNVSTSRTAGATDYDYSTPRRFGWTINDKTHKIYDDGVEVDSVTRNTDLMTDSLLSEKLYIGSYSGAGADHYGHIKNIRIYDFVLTATEVGLA